MEIERKYLLDKIPFNLDKFKKTEIKQGYISIAPTIRIRQWDDKYILTIKSKSKLYENMALAKEEFEIELSQEEFINLQKKVDMPIISKNRYIIPIENGLTAELDIYFSQLQGLMTVEVEFSNIIDAENFQPPLWFGTDVTFDKSYSNAHLSKYGLPKKLNN